jgi:hypothetical protein
VDPALTLEPTELETAGLLGTGLEASPVADETGLEPSGVLDGTEVEVSPGPDGMAVLCPATEVAVAEHAVQTVAVEVKVTVETVCDVVTKVEEPEVTVSVTGHVVTVS